MTELTSEAKRLAALYGMSVHLNRLAIEIDALIEKRVALAVAKCFRATLPRDGEAWSRDALEAAKEIRNRMAEAVGRPAPVDDPCEQRLAAALEPWEQLRVACADILGCDTDWPQHGNAPLAIASALSLRVKWLREAEQRVAAAVQAERERCAGIANAARRKYRDMDAFIADEIYQDIRGSAVGRFPADRPAPPPLEIAFREAREEWERQARWEGPPPDGMTEDYLALPQTGPVNHGTAPNTDESKSPVAGAPGEAGRG